MANIRTLPAVEKRVESGAIRFGDDWPGLFLRGDQAGDFMLHLRFAVERLKRLEPKMLPSEAMHLTRLQALVDHIQRDVIIH